MTTITRFAPAPTGRLHVGNIRTALHNFLFAKKRGGRFLLRIDDTDAERSREEYVEAIRADLAWLGLMADSEARQSERLALYDNAFDRLLAAERIYPAYETAQELELKRKIQLGRGRPPIYDRTALALSYGDREKKEAEGTAPHWRFKLDHDEPIAWEDGIRGPQHFDPAQLSDPVIRRADGSWLYMLPSTVDDIEMGVTDVLRGEDHVSNTAVQIQMFTALGATVPNFAHEALLVSAEGKLSKRLGSFGVSEFRDQGYEPMAINSLLARLGTSQPVVAEDSLDALTQGFDLSTFGRAPARFDEAELARINTQLVHSLPFEAVRELAPEGFTEEAWLAVRPNLEKASEAAEWWQVITGPIEGPDLPEEDRAYAAEAAEALAWGDDPWHALTDALKTRTGRKGKALFLPLRLALTGHASGPDMGQLLPLIGEDEARTRLRRAANR